MGKEVVAVDRQERGLSHRSTLAELEDELSVPVLPVVTIREIVEYLAGTEASSRASIDSARRERIEEYLKRYGPDASTST